MADLVLGSQTWDAAGFGGTLPDDTHNAWIPETLDGDVTGGLDQGSKDVDLIDLAPGYTRSLGASGSPLQIACDVLRHNGRGNLYYMADGNAGGLDTDVVIINCANPQAVTELTSDDGGEFHEIYLESGIVRMLGAIEFDAAAFARVKDGVSLTIVSGADTLATLTQNGGTVHSSGVVTTYNCNGGRLTQDVAAIGTLYVAPGAVVDYRHTALTTVYVDSGGTLILNSNRLAKTITTGTFMPGAIIVSHPSLVTVTNENDYRIGTVI